MTAQKFNSALETNPILGWAISAMSFTMGGLQWVMDHADDFTKLIGFATALLGFCVGYYTFRIQRRAWLKAKSEDKK